MEKGKYTDGKTTILIDKITVKRMKQVKIYHRETYNDIIIRLINGYYGIKE